MVNATKYYYLVCMDLIYSFFFKISASLYIVNSPFNSLKPMTKFPEKVEWKWNCLIVCSFRKSFILWWKVKHSLPKAISLEKLFSLWRTGIGILWSPNEMENLVTVKQFLKKYIRYFSFIYVKKKSHKVYWRPLRMYFSIIPGKTGFATFICWQKVQ